MLESVSFTIEPGEAVGIMGRNGCGKSTLLKLLCGIYQPDSGSVAVRAPITPLLELGIGWNPELDAVDNILLIGTVMGLSLKEAKGAVGQILAFAGLERFASLELKHYSSGMAARLAYATAFAALRDVLIIDEVFAVGDEGFNTVCYERCRELNEKGHTLVVVSHDPKIIERSCRRAFLLDRGRIVVSGSGREVADAYHQLYAGGEHGVGTTFPSSTRGKTSSFPP